jgi:drug/metabolite transporter (DMT)-like permease
VAGSLLIIVSAGAFGFMALFAHWARGDGVSTEMLLLLRFGIAGGALALWMFIRRMRPPRGRDLLLAMAMGGVLYAGMSACYFHGLRYIPAGLVALLLYLYPVIVTILARVLLNERLTPIRLAAIATAVIGLVMTSAPSALAALSEMGAVDSRAMIGIALGLGCALCYSAYILVGGPVSHRAGAIPTATVVMLAAACVFAAVALPRGDSLPLTPRGWAGVLGLSLFSTLLAITAFLAGLRRVGPVQASTLSTLEAVTAVIIGAAFLGDRFAPVQVVGGVLILIAAIILARTQVAPSR